MLWVNCKLKDTNLLLLHCGVRRDPFTHQVYPCLPSTWSHTRNITSLIFHIYTHTNTLCYLYRQKTNLLKNKHKINCYFWSLSVAFQFAPRRVCNTQRKHFGLFLETEKVTGGTQPHPGKVKSSLAQAAAVPGSLLGWFVTVNLRLFSLCQTNPTLTFLPSIQIQQVQMWIPHKCEIEHMNGYSHLHNYPWRFKENVTICRMLGGKIQVVHLW